MAAKKPRTMQEKLNALRKEHRLLTDSLDASRIVVATLNTQVVNAEAKSVEATRQLSEIKRERHSTEADVQSLRLQVARMTGVTQAEELWGERMTEILHDALRKHPKQEPPVSYFNTIAGTPEA